MIDSKTLSEFLTSNVHPDLYPQFLVLSRNGKLVAYSTPTDINRIEDQAALVAMAWKDSIDKSGASTDRKSGPVLDLRALTIESEAHNIIVQPIQSNLLLVLVGGLPPPGGAAHKFKITHEAPDDPPYPVDERKLEEEVVALTAESHDAHRAALNALRMQRRKLDNLADTILAESRKLSVPDDSQFGFS